MKYLIVLVLTAVLVPAAVADEVRKLTREQQEFCISVFEKYYREKVSPDASGYLETVSEILVQNAGETAENIAAQQSNVNRIDSIMRECVRLVRVNDPQRLLQILEPEIRNIQCHPSSYTRTVCDFSAAMSLIYGLTLPDEYDYFRKVAGLADFCLLRTEVMYALRPEIALPLYRRVLKDVVEVYLQISLLAKERDDREEMEHADKMVRSAIEKLTGLAGADEGREA